MKIALFFTLAFFAITIESAGWMTPEQKSRAEQFISVFESDTTELQYSYCENDGRGYTSGRAGFRTGKGNAVKVIRKYTKKKSSNPLAKFLPELERLAKEGSDDVSHLDGYCKAWEEASRDPEFKQIQDEVNDKFYFTPAMHHADQVCIKSELGKTAFYDTIVQHGDGDDEDSIKALVELTTSNMHGSPKSGVDEEKWIREFLKVRRDDLQHPHNLDKKDEWEQSVDRVDSLVKLLDDGNMDMHGPIHIKTENHEATIE